MLSNTERVAGSVAGALSVEVTAAGEAWESAPTLESEVRVLQSKLMEMHTKLMDQLDVCK